MFQIIQLSHFTVIKWKYNEEQQISKFRKVEETTIQNKNPLGDTIMIIERWGQSFKPSPLELKRFEISQLNIKY
jgi:hypothetical protein